MPPGEADLDGRVRVRAFEFLREQTALHGEVLPHSVLTGGFIFARFCYHTGWRTKSEVFPLTWAQVDWNGGFIRLEPGTTKNREGRAFEEIKAIGLELMLRQRVSGVIIPLQEGSCRADLAKCNVLFPPDGFEDVGLDHVREREDWLPVFRQVNHGPEKPLSSRSRIGSTQPPRT
jgi:hypothetical protein